MEENKYIHLLKKHGSKLLLSLLAIACVIVWGERFMNRNRSLYKQDFFIANQILERFSKGEPLAIEIIESTENILKRHPELHPKYDAMLATTLFSQQKVDKGLIYAHSTMDHVKAGLPPFYRDFANTSLLIADKKYEPAFQEAQNLNAQLVGQEGYETLSAMNLLRLVFLADELGQNANKKEAWQQLQKQPAYASLAHLFQEGKLSLADYITVD